MTRIKINEQNIGGVEITNDDISKKQKTAYCKLHDRALSKKLMIKRKCLEKGCYHLDGYAAKKAVKIKKYQNVNVDIRIRLRDLKNTINNKEKVNFEDWLINF